MEEVSQMLSLAAENVDKGFLAFREKSADELEQIPGKLMQQGSAQAKRIVKLAGMFFTVLILLTVVLGIVLINILG